jgi:hypothetical protein
MKGRRIIGVALAAAVLAGLMLVGPASADAGIKRLAKAECREERLTEPAEFAALYGGGGHAAIKRCARAQRREARADCVQDRAEERSEFALEYGGTGKAAIKRCMRDELR